MLKLKQILKTPIILFILGSICLSPITYWGINLLNKLIITLLQEPEARQNVSALMRYEHLYFSESANFSGSCSAKKLGVGISPTTEFFPDSCSAENLGLGISPDTENYRYRIYTAFQTTLNDYLFLDLDKTTIKSSIIKKDWEEKKAQNPLIISSNIVMIAALPKKTGLKSYIGFVFICGDDRRIGTPDCGDDVDTTALLYESELPLTRPPNGLRLNVSLPLSSCDRRGCIGEQFPTPKGFHLYKNN